MSTTYTLYYWPGLPGRGEFVRLILEQAGAEYVDVVRLPQEQGGGIPALMSVLRGEHAGMLPLAPPILQADDLYIAQVANICLFLGRRHGLVAEDEASWTRANQLQLTIADLVAEAHDTHHPLWTMKYYEDQKEEAKKRADGFVRVRMPKFLNYFERVLQSNTTGQGRHLVGDALSYVDLSMFQVLEGLSYAFPQAFAHVRPDIPGLLALRDHVTSLPRIASYLQSSRRLPFCEDGIFRHYPELDLSPDETSK
ncbi:MAG: glutathione S-transferase family protein [Myxococcales bacterium]|nr:glutathione S-transferase family protein [Myxococcales bacterium]